MDRHERRLLWVALAAGATCAGLACVPTMEWAAVFAHPARVERLGGAIPEATVRGATFFRIALVAATVLIPTLVWRLQSFLASQRTRTHPARRITPRSRRGWLGLTGIIVLGAVLRIATAEQSLWYDEISAFLSFAIEGPGVAFGSYTVPTNHVPMTLAVWFAWALTGSTHELVLRAPAIIAGIGALPIAYALGATIFGTRAGYIAAYVLALAPIPIVESAEARGYAFVIFASLVAALGIARAERTRAPLDFLLFALAAAFAAWSHPVAILVALAAGLVGLVRDRALAIAALLAGVLAAVLLSPLAGDVIATRADYVHRVTEQPTVFSREGYESIVGLTLGWSSRVFILPPAVPLLLFIAGLFMLFRIDNARTRSARRVLLPFGLALALAWMLSIALGTWMYARFVLFTVPIGVVLMTLALERWRYSLAIWMPFILYGSAWSSAARDYSVKQPIRDAVEYVARERGPNERVATIGLPDNAVGFYAQRYGFEATQTGFLGKDLDEVVARTQPTFIVALYPDRIDAAVRARLESGFEQSARLEGWADWGHGAVEVWRARPSTAQPPVDRAR